MYRFIINKRYVNLLREIAKQGKNDILKISRNSDMDYTHVSRLIKQFTAEKIVVKNMADEGPGRKVDVSLTDKGQAIMECFDKIEEIMAQEIEYEKEVDNGKN